MADYATSEFRALLNLMAELYFAKYQSTFYLEIEFVRMDRGFAIQFVEYKVDIKNAPKDLVHILLN